VSEPRLEQPQKQSAIGKRRDRPMDGPGRFDPELPLELRAAPIQFETWSQARLLEEQAAASPSDPLYHYTTETGFRGILGSGRIRCFSHFHQRDEVEFEYSLRIARVVIREIGRNAGHLLVQQFCECLEDMLATNSFRTTFSFFLFSLSQHRDHPSQWREYGGRGEGFAIGFAPRLFVPDRTTLSSNPLENIYVGRVLYGDGPTEGRHRQVIQQAAQITSYIGQLNAAVVEQHRIRYLVSMAREVIASQLVWNCLTAKHLKYQDEREVRYVIMGTKKKFENLVQVQQGSRREFVEHSLPLRDGTVEILIGPLAPAGTEAIVREFLQKNGYPSNVAIRRSKART
jgi:hypothetical protein